MENPTTNRYVRQQSSQNCQNWDICEPNMNNFCSWDIRSNWLLQNDLHLMYIWSNCTFILVFLKQTLWQLYPPLKIKGLFVWGNSWTTESLYHFKSWEWIVQPIRRQECKYHACKCIKSASRVQKYLNQLSSVHNTGLSSDREGVKVEVRRIRG